MRGHDRLELGDCRRFANSRDAVRYSGLDITVYQSDRHRAPGHLSRQGPPALRWALYEAAQAARRPGSPDRAYYEQAAERLGGNRACLALARKLLKRCYHTLRELGDDALAPPARSGAGSAAARRASSASPRVTKPAATPNAQMPSPLDPGFGRAVWQRVPARPELPNTNIQTFARAKPSLTPCAAASSRCPAADTPPAWTA